MKRLIVTLLIGAVLAGYGYGIWWAVDDYNTGKDVVVSRTYEGRLYLPTGEYESFKQYLADNPQVEIARLDVLSSPNALVDMSLVAPADTLVPYGEVVKERTRADLSLHPTSKIALMSGGIFLIIPFLLTLLRTSAVKEGATYD